MGTPLNTSTVPTEARTAGMQGCHASCCHLCHLLHLHGLAPWSKWNARELLSLYTVQFSAENVGLILAPSSKFTEWSPMLCAFHAVIGACQASPTRGASSCLRTSKSTVCFDHPTNAPMCSHMHAVSQKRPFWLRDLQRSMYKVRCNSIVCCIMYSTIICMSQMLGAAQISLSRK